MASEAHEVGRKPEDEAGELHRLRDIVVEEVSLVDRAANKRRFLVLKRSGHMADEAKLGAEVKPDGRGGVTAAGGVEKAKKKPDDEPDAGDAEKARRRCPAEGDEAGSEAAKARRRAAPEETEKARRRAAEDEENAENARRRDDEDKEDEDEEDTEKARRGKGEDDEDEAEAEKARRSADEDEEETAKANGDAPTMPKPVKAAMLRALTEACERLMSVANRVKEAGETDEKVETPVPADLARDIAAVAELLEGIGESNRSPSAKAAVAKAGKRMAKDRLDRFEKALALLSQILGELTEAKAPVAPTAGAAEDRVSKRDTPEIPGLRELVANVGELTRIVKRQEEELGRIRQARGVSNAIPVDGGGRRAEPQEVSWPLDMNRPISRDSVGKAVSFFDD